MKLCSLLGALALIVGLSPLASAQVVRTERGTDPLLAQTWFENEGMWRGVWVPARPDSRDGQFSANWTLIGHSDTERAGLQITIEGDAVTITRTGRSGHCTYHGALSADRRSVSGNYACDSAPNPMHWSATFGNQQAPDQLPAWNANEFFRYTWLEREGAWRGTWTPLNRQAGDGQYEGRWTQPPNTGGVSAQLSMTVDAAQHFTIRRTQPQGTCTYQGDFTYNSNTNVSGTYTCDWARTPLPWSAVIQSPVTRH